MKNIFPLFRNKNDYILQMKPEWWKDCKAQFPTRISAAAIVIRPGEYVSPICKPLMAKLEASDT